MLAQSNSANPFIPQLATLAEVRELTYDVKLFRVELEDVFPYQPGQFAFLSAFGMGEAPFSITSLYSPPVPGILSPSSAHTPPPGLEFAIRRVGTVSAALHELEPGALVGVRGPFGHPFPIDEYRGKNLVIIAGGIGLAPLRPVLKAILGKREEFGELLIIYGARSPADLVFASEFEDWAGAPRTRLELTVDRGDDYWPGRVALVPAVIKELKPSPEQAVAIICGPPIMIRFVLAELKALDFANSQIVTTLEAKMKCGMGKCARCNIGDKYVCQDGPVFTFEQISAFLEQL